MAERGTGLRAELRAALRGEAEGDGRVHKLVEEIRQDEGGGHCALEIPPGFREDLLAACAEELAAQSTRVENEHAYALVRALYHRLDPTPGGVGLCPFLGRVGLTERDEVVARYAPAHAAASVAVPLADLGAAGHAIGITRRSMINGYTGGPMSNAGEVVLFGGAADVGEIPALTALRELVEEAGIDGVGDLRYDPCLELGRWTTEAGFRATGFLVNVPPEFPAVLRPDAREVDDIGFIGLDALFQAEFRPRHHLVTTLDAARRPVAVGWYESPTCLVTDVDGARQWLLWGLAGHMLHRLRTAHPGPEAVVAAARARRKARAERRYLPDSVCPGGLSGLAVAAHRVRRFMTSTLGIPRPPLVRAPALSELFGEPVLLALDSTLPIGGSTKIRALSGLLYAALEALAETPAGDPPPAYHPGEERRSLAELFDGATLIAASTGSHAYAVLSLSRWLRTELGVDTGVELFLSSDISEAKARLLDGSGVSVTMCSNFNSATRHAHAREEYLSNSGRRAVFLPSDPERRFNQDFVISGMDSTIGLATLLLDIADSLTRNHRDLGLPGPAVTEVRIPTSGGATWASCVALASAAESGAVRELIGTIGAVYDAASPTVPTVLADGDPSTVVPVEWAESVNGLAQPEIAPGAWYLLRAAGQESVPHPLYPVTRAAATVARALIELDTGIHAQLAGAAATGSALLAHVGQAGPSLLDRIGEVLRSRPAVPGLADALRRCAVDAERLRPAPVHPPGPRVYVVSGGEPGPV